MYCLKNELYIQLFYTIIPGGFLFPKCSLTTPWWLVWKTMRKNSSLVLFSLLASVLIWSTSFLLGSLGRPCRLDNWSGHRWRGVDKRRGRCCLFRMVFMKGIDQLPEVLHCRLLGALLSKTWSQSNFLHRIFLNPVTRQDPPANSLLAGSFSWRHPEAN